MQQENQVAPVMSVKDWMITYLIFIIPIVNIIMLFVWAFGSGSTANPNKINFAKANLIWAAIVIVLCIIIFVIAFIIGMLLASSSGY